MIKTFTYDSGHGKVHPTKIHNLVSRILPSFLYKPTILGIKHFINESFIRKVLALVCYISRVCKLCKYLSKFYQLKVAHILKMNIANKQKQTLVDSNQGKRM